MEVYNSFPKVAVLVDGSYFLKRYKYCFPKNSLSTEDAAKKVVDDLYAMCKKHTEDSYLYRIFFYDCPPFHGRGHLPISKKAIDYSKTTQFKFRTRILEELKKRRKMALRLGEIRTSWEWKIDDGSLKEILTGDKSINQITDDSFTLIMQQKGVDIKIGVDIASLAYKKLVDKIILIAGDSDFVPAAKIARREGIDFVLDPMWNHIHDELFEHIDGLKSVCSKPVRYPD